MHVVITGGSSGIGLEVARCYVRRGASVSIIGRDQVRLDAARAELEKHAGGRVFTASADVAAADTLSLALTACEAAAGPCDILVASAGIVDPMRFHEQSGAAFDAQWQTNFVGTINAVRHVYGGMRERRQGRIMIVSSAAAFIGIPAYTSYCASKAALVGFIDALRLEAMAANVHIGICFPPDTDTPQLSYELQRRPAEAELLMGRIRARPPETIAAMIVKGIDRRSTRVYFSLSIAALAMLGPWAKPWVELWFRVRTRGRIQQPR